MRQLFDFVEPEGGAQPLETVGGAKHRVHLLLIFRRFERQDAGTSSRLEIHQPHVEHVEVFRRLVEETGQ